MAVITPKKRLCAFENRIWTTICGPIYDNGMRIVNKKIVYSELREEIGMWWQVSSFKSGQRI